MEAVLADLADMLVCPVTPGDAHHDYRPRLPKSSLRTLLRCVSRSNKSSESEYEGCYLTCRADRASG